MDKKKIVYRGWVLANNLTINPHKSQCLVVCRTTIDTKTLSPILINGRVIQFTSTAKNFGITLNNTLTWHNHMLGVIGKVYGMLRTLWAQQSCKSFKMRIMLWIYAFLAPTLLYGCELFANCDAFHKQKLRVLFNNIARYVYKRRRFDSISIFSKQLFGLSFDNLLKFRMLSFLHKIIYSECPVYLFERLRFARSNRGQLLIPPRHSYQISQQQFFLFSIKLWNALPHNLQTRSSFNTFRDGLFEHLAAN